MVERHSGAGQGRGCRAPLAACLVGHQCGRGNSPTRLRCAAVHPLGLLPPAHLRAACGSSATATPLCKPSNTTLLSRFLALKPALAPNM